jgi:hypothetical protein
MDMLVAGPHDASAAGEAIWNIFANEWRLQRGDTPLRSIAIVDDAPEQQYLYPEFRLFKALFERHGCTAVIADPTALAYRNDALWHDAARIDMVYNRLTDFALDAPACTALRAAYRDGNVVLTPHPQAHALYADKRNLVLLSNPKMLRELGASAFAIDSLAAGVPLTELVNPGNAGRLWAQRRGLFFKPAAGFGGKAAYRGDKLTRRVWDEIVAGTYVAQALVRPSERLIGSSAAPLALKLDLRNYAYEGRVILTAARTYQGQTTNFRTPGGGFAPVLTEARDPSVPREAGCGDMCADPASPGRIAGCGAHLAP